MKRSLLFTACCVLLVLGFAFVSCTKKEEPPAVSDQGETVKGEEQAAAANEDKTVEELVTEAETLYSDAEELDQAVEEGKVSGNEAVQTLEMLKQQREELKQIAKFKAQELATTAFILMMDKANKKLNKVSRSVGMEVLPEDEDTPETKDTHK